MMQPPSSRSLAALRGGRSVASDGRAPLTMEHITSRDNPLVKRLRKLAQDPGAYRKQGELWLEGDHLCRAARARGVVPRLAVLSEAASAQSALCELAAGAPRVVVLPDALFASLSALESPAPIAWLLGLPEPAALRPGAATVVFDRLQDAGNAGSILRSAAALGVRQVLALKGTVALWSPKVLRAAMGAHFALDLIEGLAPDDVQAVQLPLIATSPHARIALPDADLPRPCAWIVGHEGQGVAPGLLERCTLTLRIPQPGGEESLNVAAAAAICLYDAARRQ
jgi:TrmH family RNA methyltransferase